MQNENLAFINVLCFLLLILSIYVFHDYKESRIFETLNMKYLKRLDSMNVLMQPFL